MYQCVYVHTYIITRDNQCCSDKTVLHVKFNVNMNPAARNKTKCKKVTIMAHLLKISLGVVWHLQCTHKYYIGKYKLGPMLHVTKGSSDSFLHCR